MSLLESLGTGLPRRCYLGIDIGYKEHVAAVIRLETFVSGNSGWKHAKCVHFPSTRAGLRILQRYLDSFCTDPAAFFGLCEPTGGYYGASVFQYLLERGYDMNWVENAMTRHIREKIFPGTPKTDEMESRVMARMGYLHEAVGEEFTLRTLQLPAVDDADLLALCRDSWKLQGMITRARNQFTQLVAGIFPELKTFFTKSVSTVGPVSLMAAYATPKLLSEAPEEDIRRVLQATSCHRHAKRVSELQELARDSSGVRPNPGRLWRVNYLTSFLLTNFPHQKALDHQIKELVEQRDDYHLVVKVPRSGPATLGAILAVTGDVTRFPNYRTYVAYTGYFPGLEKSQTIDRTKMSRRGNRNLKRALFQIAAPLVWFDRDSNPYKELYQRKMAEGRAWYKAMPFVCAALARHIYHCLKFNDPYDVDKAFQGSTFIPATDEESLDLGANLDKLFEALTAFLDQEEP